MPLPLMQSTVAAAAPHELSLSCEFNQFQELSSEEAFQELLIYYKRSIQFHTKS
jgi:hypothetical protein